MADALSGGRLPLGRRRRGAGGAEFAAFGQEPNRRHETLRRQGTAAARRARRPAAARRRASHPGRPGRAERGAGLPKSGAIFQDNPASPSAAPYVNIFVVRAADKNNPLYLKLAALYHDPAVEKGVQQANGGTAVFRTVSPAALQAELATVEAQERAAQAQQ
jgi:NlpA lipoprotein